MELTEEEKQFMMEDRRDVNQMEGDAQIICYCSHVIRGEILDAWAHGARTLKDIKRMTGACTLRKCKEMNPEGT